MGGAGSHLAGAPVWPVPKSCGLPEKQKRILSSFSDGNEEHAPTLACMGAHCASLNMPRYC